VTPQQHLELVQLARLISIVTDGKVGSHNVVGTLFLAYGIFPNIVREVVIGHILKNQQKLTMC
jgi:hypothetical protein